MVSHEAASNVVSTDLLSFKATRWLVCTDAQQCMRTAYPKALSFWSRLCLNTYTCELCNMYGCIRYRIPFSVPYPISFVAE